MQLTEKNHCCFKGKGKVTVNTDLSSEINKSHSFKVKLHILTSVGIMSELEPASRDQAEKWSLLYFFLLASFLTSITKWQWGAHFSATMCIFLSCAEEKTLSLAVLKRKKLVSMRRSGTESSSGRFLQEIFILYQVSIVNE